MTAHSKKVIVASLTVGALALSFLAVVIAKKRQTGAGDAKADPHSHPHPTADANGDSAHGHSHGKGDGIRPVSTLPKRGYTKEELSQFDGVRNPRIFVSLKRKVYEVAPQFYGPGAAYHIFAGKEASRCLAKSLLDGKDANKYWVDCSEEELQTLDEYVDTFESKYPVVGWYIPDKSFYEV